MNLRDENCESVMQYFGYVAILAHLGLRRTVNCVLMDVQISALSRSVTVFLLKTRFLVRICSNSNVFSQYYPEGFCDHKWKFNLKHLQ